MRTRFVAAVSILSVLAGSAFAQDAHRSPYAGLETRAIKAVSARQIADLRAGRGMALALAAELNGYPGPQHVLDLAAELGLSDAQRARIRELTDAMKTEAIALGETLVAQEAALDTLFAERSVTPESLAAATRASGDLQASLRHAHLASHLVTITILTPHQIRRYAELRGYGGRGHEHPTP
jgi:LTXXQ motif family protein